MKLGATDISNIKLGAVDVSKVYLGSSVVWSSVTGSAATLSTVQFTDGDITGSVDQHGTLYVITSAEATRTAAQIKAETGAEDAFALLVNLGNFDFTLDLATTTVNVQRYMHFVLENDNGFSNVAVVPFELTIGIQSITGATDGIVVDHAGALTITGRTDGILLEAS